MKRLGSSLILTGAAVVPLAALVVWTAYSLVPWAGAGEGAVVDGVREITVRVHAWGFSPSVIHVRRGESIRFAVSTEDINHGFAINELGVNVPLRGDRPSRSATIVVDLADGVYAIHCSVFCGLGHPTMKGKLVVGDAPPAPERTAPWIASLAGTLLLAGAAAAVRASGRYRR